MRVLSRRPLNRRAQHGSPASSLRQDVDQSRRPASCCNATSPTTSCGPPIEDTFPSGDSSPLFPLHEPASPSRPSPHLHVSAPYQHTFPSLPIGAPPSPPCPPFSGNSSALEHSCNLDTPLAHSIPLHLFYPLPLSYISVSCISLLVMPPLPCIFQQPPTPCPPEPLGPSTRALFFLRVWQDNKEEQQE